MATIRPPNATEWMSDYVIHDSDAKPADILMAAVGRSAESPKSLLPQRPAQHQP